MIWQNLWAFAGLALLSLPVIIHLLSRKRAIQQKFPSLRFLNVSRLLPTRSPNLSDIPLLIVRLAIVLFAVLALAQPLFVSAARRQSFNRSLARVIVVDTSLSMKSATAAGKPALDSARALAAQLASEGTSSVVLSTVSPSAVLPGAAAWLASQGGRGEVVVLSDFQTGAVDSVSLALVPDRYGVRVIRVGQSPAAANGVVLNTLRTNVSATVDSARTVAEWSAASSLSNSIQVSAANSDAADLAAAMDAASAVASSAAADSAKPVSVLFAGAEIVASVASSAKEPSQSWMSGVLLRVQEDALLSAAAGEATVADTTIPAPFAVVARTSSGAPVVFAAQTASGNSNRLTFISRLRAGTLASAALIAAVSNAVALPSTLPESDPGRLSDEALKRFERAPQDVGADNAGSERDMSGRQGLSDGRWFWLVALVLLGLEAWMRRKTTESAEVGIA